MTPLISWSNWSLITSHHWVWWPQELFLLLQIEELLYSKWVMMAVVSENNLESHHIDSLFRYLVTKYAAPLVFGISPLKTMQICCISISCARITKRINRFTGAENIHSDGMKCRILSLCDVGRCCFKYGCSFISVQCHLCTLHMFFKI